MKKILSRAWALLDGKKRLLSWLVLLAPISSQPMLVDAIQKVLADPSSANVFTVLGQIGLAVGVAHGLVKSGTAKRDDEV